MTKRIRKRKPVHPGQMVKLDVLEPLNLSVTEAAKVMNVSRKHLSAFVNERIPCSKDMAKRLAIALGTSVDVWLGMQNALDVWEMENSNDDIYQSVGKLVAVNS
ncbi:HigA family addiction module antitoxin [Endozoicomonas sp. ONNA2]|uniref:HigA family addiction module antitoxin n=1 Tax=Endozoicomonas sp. ONNA2 TaxID=2828741 RepID=UPI0021476F15|nr:HigA family addiction module antitoxin [Endozoicomonas sp. ONNA2]